MTNSALGGAGTATKHARRGVQARRRYLAGKSSAAGANRTVRLSCGTQLSPTIAIGLTRLAIDQMSNFRAIASAFFLPMLR
jgi:hypothetical protein